MIINWFPGHMKKTLEEMQKNAKLCDAIIYVLDARVPESSFNPKIDSIVEHKPILYVLNKADLADENATKKFVQKFKDQGKNVISLVSSESKSKNKILDELKKMLAEKIEKNNNKNINVTYKVMVIGVPNTGKSSIINALASNAKTVTGNKAGVTKMTQWVKMQSNFVLLDTPGTLWPKFEDQNLALKLAFVGSIKDDVLDIEELGFALIDYLIKRFPKNIVNRYGEFDQTQELIEIYNGFCKNRGFILKNKEIDYLRAGRGFLDDFRTGKIGRLTLDEI